MTLIENSCCFTGYRPEKFGFSFCEDDKNYQALMTRIVTSISIKIKEGVTDFYTGMAQGFDILAAEHVALVKKLNKKIRLIAVIPFENQEATFTNDWKTRYHELLKSCDEVIILNKDYTKWAYNQRNRYMVDRCRHIITYFDGKKGGTMNTVNYAVRHCREVLNIYDTDPLAERKAQFKTQFKIFPPNNDTKD